MQDLCGVGGVQDVEFRVSLLPAEGCGQNFRKEAGAPHSQQQQMGQSLPANILNKLLQVRTEGRVLRQRQPAQPAAFIAARPE